VLVACATGRRSAAGADFRSLDSHLVFPGEQNRKDFV
jgi:hypothetical protein